MPIEPFHLRQEREAGFFDDEGNYIAYKDNLPEDAWLESLPKGTPMALVDAVHWALVGPFPLRQEGKAGFFGKTRATMLPTPPPMRMTWQRILCRRACPGVGLPYQQSVLACALGAVSQRRMQGLHQQASWVS